MPKIIEILDTLRAYQFHGLSLETQHGGKQAVGDCPWCGREGKFSLNLESGLWQCWSCKEGSEKGGGNLLTFLRHLWNESDKRTNGETKVLTAERGLLYPDTLTAWGVVQSIITKEWLVPGYDPNGKLVQLYKYSKHSHTGKMTLFATPGLHHGIHGSNFKAGKPTLYICEGPWDGMALWETMRIAKPGSNGTLDQTGSETASLLSGANVVAVPGCKVFFESWLPLCAGKIVCLMYDSDHPKENQGKLTEPDGWTGMRRVAKMLAKPGQWKPKEIRCIRWGESGYDPSAKSGYDIRDVLIIGDSATSRISLLSGLLGKVEPIPADWIGGRTPIAIKNGNPDIAPEECKSWKMLINVWKKALLWHKPLEDTLAAMLAVAASTTQVGDQLFLTVIADAGSAKTRLCDAMLVSKNCFALEHLTGFHSGWKDGSGEDFSLLSRINHKTLITPEGDVLMSSPHFASIMSQQRRIFDGTSGASYKNEKVDRRYTGLRTPWIIAGTPALMDTDQSRVGDRFLRVVMPPPSEDNEREICLRAGYAALRGVCQESNGDANTSIDGSLLDAYRLTGGYVDYLRSGVTDLVSIVISGMTEAQHQELILHCYELGRFAAAMRSRPNEDKRKIEQNDTKELPSRLTSQLVRLACCGSVVIEKDVLSKEVMRLVKKVALDTGHGRVFTLCKLLSKVGRKGESVQWLAIQLGEPTIRVHNLLRFLRRVDIGDVYEIKGHNGQYRWRLSPRMTELWEGVVCAEDR